MNELAANRKLKLHDALCVGFKIVALARIARFVLHLGGLLMTIVYKSESGGPFFAHPQYEIRSASPSVLGLMLAVLLLVFARRLALLIVAEDKEITSLADGWRVAASIIGVWIVLIGVADLLWAILMFMQFGANNARPIVWDAGQSATYEIILDSLVICTGIYFAWGANWLVDYVCGLRPEPEAYDAE